jgi:protein-L-isoaspartate O-methyltransferase
MNWQAYADRLAEQVSPPASLWRGIISAVPRHVFVSRWWTPDGADRWTIQDGTSDIPAWLDAAYSDRSLVTQIGTHHADDTPIGGQAIGRPTSSATLPGLLLQMYDHAYLEDHVDILDVGTGSGYGCALLAARFGDGRVTSIDVDEHLTKRAIACLDSIGMEPLVVAVDATGPLPGSYDRIIATVAVRPIPASWLTALRPGGRLVTTITDTTLILTVDATDDGGAEGRIEWDRAGFMHSRTGPDYPPTLTTMLARIRSAAGTDVTRGRYPVINVPEAWEVSSMLGVLAPGIEHHYGEDGEARTAWMLHSDGSWARATGHTGERPEVHQGGPRRLWDLLDDIRHRWLTDGSLPLYGARVRVDPDGVIHLRRGKWQHTITV